MILITILTCISVIILFNFGQSLANAAAAYFNDMKLYSQDQAVQYYRLTSRQEIRYVRAQIFVAIAMLLLSLSSCIMLYNRQPSVHYIVAICSVLVMFGMGKSRKEFLRIRMHIEAIRRKAKTWRDYTDNDYYQFKRSKRDTRNIRVAYIYSTLILVFSVLTID